MKRICYLTLLVFCGLLTGCIKSEPANPEADIETFGIDSSARTGNVFIDQSNGTILLYLTGDAYRNGVVPVITVSKGGTVTPRSGDSLRFDRPVSYVVTSASGANHKTYSVKVVSVGNWTFNFERWAVQSSNNYEYPVEADGSTIWSSGNAGVALAGVTKTPASYPTRSTSQGWEGSVAAEMVTLKATAFAEALGKRIFSGSLFLGNFNTQSALSNPLAATEFGQPYKGHPVLFTGYYQYAPGASYQDETGAIVNGKQDSCAIYAVLFKGTARLDGTNLNTSDRVVARADFKGIPPAASLTRFEIPFVYVPGADISGDLMITIVASSSKDGDYFRGAIGSRLVVDSLRIINQ